MFYVTKKKKVEQFQLIELTESRTEWQISISGCPTYQIDNGESKAYRNTT